MKGFKYEDTVNRWGVFEAELMGPDEGNPFTEQSVHGVFNSSEETVECEGFYDGDGIYRIRFMPSFEGMYFFEITSTFTDKKTGSFFVLPARERNHGPVRIKDTWHMVYEDGTPYFSIGTTCYVWTLQPEELIEKTLQTLS